MKLDELMRDISGCHGISLDEIEGDSEDDMDPKKTIMDNKLLQDLVNTLSFDIDTEMMDTISKLSASYKDGFNTGEDMAKKKEQIDELWKKITGNPPPADSDNPSIFTVKTEGGSMSFECKNELCAICAWYIINEFVSCALFSQTGEVIVRGLTGQYKVSALQQAGFFMENVAHIANAIWETVCVDAVSYPAARVEAEEYKKKHSIDKWIDHVGAEDTANPFAKNLRQIREMASALHRHRNKTCVKESNRTNGSFRDNLGNRYVSSNDSYSPYVPTGKSNKATIPGYMKWDDIVASTSTPDMLLEFQRNSSIQTNQSLYMYDRPGY